MVLEKERSGNYCHFHGEQTWTTLKETKWICAVCCFWPPKTSASVSNSGSATGNCAVFLSAGSDGRWSTQAVGMVWHLGVSKWLSGCEARSIFFCVQEPVSGHWLRVFSSWNSGNWTAFRLLIQPDLGQIFPFSSGLDHQITGKSHILGCWDLHQAPVRACDKCLGQARWRLLNGLRMPLGCHGCNPESGWIREILTNQPGFTHFIQDFLFKIVDCHKLDLQNPRLHQVAIASGPPWTAGPLWFSNDAGDAEAPEREWPLVANAASMAKTYGLDEVRTDLFGGTAVLAVASGYVNT